MTPSLLGRAKFFLVPFFKALCQFLCNCVELHMSEGEGSIYLVETQVFPLNCVSSVLSASTSGFMLSDSQALLVVA